MFLAALVPALLGGLSIAMGSLVARAVLALGIGFVTYKGITVSIDAAKASVMNAVTGLPGEVLGFLGFLWVDKGLTIIFSAVATSLSMRLLSGGLKKMVLK